MSDGSWPLTQQPEQAPAAQRRRPAPTPPVRSVKGTHTSPLIHAFILTWPVFASLSPERRHFLEAPNFSPFSHLTTDVGTQPLLSGAQILFWASGYPATYYLFIRLYFLLSTRAGSPCPGLFSCLTAHTITPFTGALRWRVPPSEQQLPQGGTHSTDGS